jgi:hypothetical protein
MPSNLPVVDASEVATLADAGYLEKLDSRALLLVLAVSGVHHTVAGALLDNTQTEGLIIKCSVPSDCKQLIIHYFCP